MSEYPLGLWRCTKSIFKDFIPNSTYECKLDSAGGPRIYPNKSSAWAPYWCKTGSFCYPESQLSFEYLGGDSGPAPLSITMDYLPKEILVNDVLFIRGELN